MSTRPRFTPAVALLAAVVAGAALLASQDPPALREVVNDITAPAMDRGIRDADPPREPRSTPFRVERSVRDGQPYVDGSLIVKFKAGTTGDARVRAMSTFGAESDGQPPWADFDIVSIPPGADPEEVAERMAERPDVEYAQPRYLNHPMFTPNDPLYSRQWNFPAIDMERAWDINPGATSKIVVAVLDTGVAYRSALVRYTGRAFRVGTTVFPALGDVDVPFAAAPELGSDRARYPNPHDFIWDDAMPLDTDGHGTHVSGTIGQLTNNGIGVAGMAFNVSIMPVKVISGDWDLIFGSRNDGTDDVVARGIRYAVDNGANVINMSIGRTAGGPAIAVRDAINYAVKQGVFVAVAAGNDFERGNPPNRIAEFAPEVDGMVAVAAVAQDKSRAYYSSTGSFVEIVAPGGDQRRFGESGGIVQQTYDSDLTETYLGSPAQFRAPRFDAFVYDFFQGTSMATPHVAGFAALLMQQGVTSPAAIEAAMKRFATDLGPTGRDDEFGAGLINPRASLRGLGLLGR